ncbi:MAG: glutamine synthetase III [Bacteroidales bacterium]|nr:glutamine synthetase III [Bacteroidales bacterium]
MTNSRFRALEIISTRKRKPVVSPKEKISDYFGELTFNQAAMHEFLTLEAYNAVMEAIDSGKRIDRKIAGQIASSLKAWAISKGASHYTHWFHPLTGATAEKHDAFIDPVEGGKAIEIFQGSALVQQEPDASSFPSGGIRNTFEARGYTAWDPSTPAFIMGETLCLPTVFVSYTGESLDYKTPLLKALSAVDKAAVNICHYFDKTVKRVSATLGWEQEYFLVDSALYNTRPDLILTGRTVFGHASAKDQQLADHYFGIIPERAMEFMKDFEVEAHKLGIPVKTRHNEVAPNQFECAPVFQEANVAVDHNQLLMPLLEKIARRHDMNVLLHEKPYARVNGSGKHNNWSFMTNDGENLLTPGKTASSNLRFLTFLVNIIKAVDVHRDLVRAGIASAGNDIRLGGHEAPPAIMSVFIGSQLTETLNNLEKNFKNGKVKANNNIGMRLVIPKIPEILLDNTDRNRTSPFAFTGNKFEFRAVGSSASCGLPMIILNTIMADQLVKFKSKVDALVANNIRKNDAVLQILRKYISESKRIRFEGNSYGEEWIKEAEKRRLSNIKSTPQALDVFIRPETIDLFERTKVLSKRELEARYEIKLNKYTKKIQIESRVIGDLARNHIIPVAIRYQNLLVENVRGLKEVLDKDSFEKIAQTQIKMIKEISGHIDIIQKNLELMLDERKKANKIESAVSQALAYNEKVLPYFDIIRRHVDKLELKVDDGLWPLPKYRELLFLQ